MNHETIAAYIADGKAVLGIEFGSTRIKAVLIGDDHAPIASGDHTWENRLEGGHLDISLWMTCGRACRMRSRICKRTCRQIMA